MKNNSTYVIWALVVIVIIGALIMWTRAPQNALPVSVDVQNPVAATTADTAISRPAQKPAAATSKVQTAKSAAPAVVARPYVKDGVKIVYYTDKGFDPFIVEVKRGRDVTFVNVDNETMRLMPIELQGKIGYAGLQQGVSVGRGGTWTTNFTQPGTWGYYNLNNPADRGAVVVAE